MVVRAYLKLQDNYGKIARSGRPPALSPRKSKAIIKSVQGKVITVRNIKTEFELNVSNSTILRLLKCEGGLKLRRLKKKPVLTDTHKANRIEFARKYMDLGERWKHVIFSDEKKFNLDGPDGYTCYWHSPYCKAPVLSKRAFGGGGIMAWACFDYFGRSKLVFLKIISIVRAIRLY